MASNMSEFHAWLCSRLKSHELDEEVLGEYIVGILNGDDSSLEEKQEALRETLDGMMETPDENFSSNIFMKWKECQEKEEKMNNENEGQKQDILAAVVEKQTKITNNIGKKLTYKIDEDVKRNVIAQYGQESDEDFCSSSEDETQTKTTKTQQAVDKDKGLFQNVNAKSVAEKEKEKREKQRKENEEKKVKIKEDKEKQKAKVEQRKEKEKKRTQKGERRR